MDVLSEILALIHISGSVLTEIRCGGAWGIDIGRRGVGIPFHYVTEGKCWLLDGASRTRLSAGDLVAAPHWPFHALASSPEHALVQLTDVIAAKGLPAWQGGTLARPLVIPIGTGKCDVRIVSGVFTLEGRGATMLIEQLPAILHLRAPAKGLAPQFRAALDFVRQESATSRPGYVAVAARLMDLLFLQILRAVITQPTVKIGLLAGLADPRLARALAAIHANPAGPWTVGNLAAEACLSRTIFAERFRQTVGLTPIQYVNRWRMTLAEDLLARPGTPIDTIRSRLGFGSSFAFARAFRAYRGLTPREYRLSVQQGRTDAS
jgi:AraC-like DNA-binding protein